MKEYLTCYQCSKSDETVKERACGYHKELFDEVKMEVICDDCEWEHTQDI